MIKAEHIVAAVEHVTKKWAKQRRREERESKAALNRRDAMTRRHSTTIKDAAYTIMKEAYLKASANGTLPAHARQIMYAARSYIQSHVSRELGHKFDVYFTQTLLPDYIRTHEEAASWDVAYDARGHLREPHTDREVPLGTIAVRNYLLDLLDAHVPIANLKFEIPIYRYPTFGPHNRYNTILFIEKEGFLPLFDRVKLAARYDLAIASTKGMSVIAFRSLIDHLAGRHNIRVLVLHDFDLSGFGILATMRRATRRYSFENDVNVIDIGFRLTDIGGLESERVALRAADLGTLEKNGATAKEIEFLRARRVELNAMPSDVFIAWLERKLKKLKVQKIVPDDKTLANAYRRAYQQYVVQRRVTEIVAGIKIGDIAIPPDLRASVERALRVNPKIDWDEAVQSFAYSPAKKDGATRQGR